MGIATTEILDRVQFVLLQTPDAIADSGKYHSSTLNAVRMCTHLR
jgi:hypothetical protein